MQNYIAQGIGFIALMIAILSFQKNSNKGILSFQVISTTMFFVHFFLLGAYTGAVMNLIGAFRNVVFYSRGKRWADSKIWLYVFIFASAIAGILTWKNLFSFLPIFGMILGTISFWVKNPKHTRYLNMIVSPSWLIYNFISSSIAGIFTEVIVIISIVVAIIRFDIRKSNSKKAEL